METLKNSLETVQLIPVFSYLNLLSDFLFVEQYLSEEDQNKQIPIINALYQYLENNEYNKSKKRKLIRNLLKSSDLYGEKEGENFDLTFVNAMFDYIISSLVFDKYGGTYGFLAKIFLYVENFQVDEVLQIIMSFLQNEEFANEYGEKSKLTFLAIHKISKDILSPLFPRSENNFNILSVDYMYAQAGSIFLQAGRMNSVYLSDFGYDDENLIDENLFDEYLITGTIIEKLILTEKRNSEILKAFALPALVYYISRSKFLFTNENMAKVISDPFFWSTAYKDLFQYTTNTFDKIEFELKNDYLFQLNMALLNFQTCTSLAENFIEKHCPLLKSSAINSSLHFYRNYPKSFVCKDGDYFFDPKGYFRRQVNNAADLLESNMLQTMKNSLSNYLLHEFEFKVIRINLLVSIDEEVKISDSKYLSYDYLEVFTPEANHFDYYIINYENYDITITKENNNTQNDDITLYFQKLKNNSIPIILKSTDENVSVFQKNLVAYKKKCLQKYLNILDNCDGESRNVKSYWWKEFGFSLMTYARCLVSAKDSNYSKVCATGSIRFLYKYPDQTSSKLIREQTQNLFHMLKINLKSVLLRNESRKAFDGFVTTKYIPSVMNALNVELFKGIALNISEPEFNQFTINLEIGVLEKVINSLKKKISFSFSNVISSLSRISILKSKYYRNIGTIDENSSHSIFVNTLNNRSDTGYGYKFIFLSCNKSDIAHLRTGYDYKDVRFFSQIVDSKGREKMYLAFNNITLKPEPDHIMYEINHQLRKKISNLLFLGISIQNDDLDENCFDEEYFQKWTKHNRCRRRQRVVENMNNKDKVIKYIKREANLTENDILNVMGKYTFLNGTTITLFVKDWLNNNFSKEYIWNEDYILENSNLLSKLMYNSHFEPHRISDFDGEFRIGSLYTRRERSEIEQDTNIHSIINSFNQQKARYSLTFHDYYAIKNYATTGYRRISRDTNEAKLMKIALYKLAIRQFDDPDEAFDRTLYRYEMKPISFLNNKSSNITLNKFTHTFLSALSAIRSATYSVQGYTNVIYEMMFSGPYARVKIEQFYNEKEENVILLPGSKFTIEDRSVVMIGGLGNVLKLKLKFQNSFENKFLWLKNIVNEIAQMTL